MILLLVEDDPALVRTLRIALQARGFEVHDAATGAGALAVTAEIRPDLAVVDLGLPDMTGVDVVRALRSASDVPILVLSARDRQEDKVEALDAGADDYMTKPFGLDELLARLRAVTRRHARAGAPSVVRTGELVIDPAARRVTRSGAPVHLTPTEWNLLEVLLRSPGHLVPGRTLLKEVWGPKYGEEANYLRVYVAQLRRKLEPDPSRPRHLLTEPGVGYRFDVLA